MLTQPARYAGRKWWYLLLMATLLAMNVWVWRQALMPLPAPQSLAPASPAHEARAPMWLSIVILVVYVAGMVYAMGKGSRILLRDLGWSYDDPHEQRKLN